MTRTPDCEFGEHSWCRTAEVVVHGVVIVKQRRCNCSCHRETERTRYDGMSPVRTTDYR